MLSIFWPWAVIAQQRKEIARLKALIGRFDHDGDGKPGGSVRAKGSDA